MVNSGSPFLTICPSCEVDAVEIAGHPRPDFDGIDGHEAADILVLIDNGFGLRPSDGHLRRWRRGGAGLRFALVAPGEGQGSQSGKQSHMQAIEVQHGYLVIFSAKDGVLLQRSMGEAHMVASPGCGRHAREDVNANTEGQQPDL